MSLSGGDSLNGTPEQIRLARRGIRPSHLCVAVVTKTGRRCRTAKTRLLDINTGEPVQYKYCLGHLVKYADPDQIEARHGFNPKKPTKGGGRPKKPTSMDVLRYRVEHELGLDEVIAPYLKGLKATRAVVVGNGPHAYVEEVSDAELSMKAADRILDRLYGKARQAVEHTGAEGGPILVDLPTDEEREEALARILARTGGLEGMFATPVNGSSNGHVNGDH